MNHRQKQIEFLQYSQLRNSYAFLRPQFCTSLSRKYLLPHHQYFLQVYKSVRIKSSCKFINPQNIFTIHFVGGPDHRTQADVFITTTANMEFETPSSQSMLGKPNIFFTNLKLDIILSSNISPSDRNPHQEICHSSFEIFQPIYLCNLYSLHR